MNRQITLFDLLLSPGLYEVVEPWSNEMGYTWKAGERVQVLDHARPLSVLVCQPADFGTGLTFHLNADRIRSHYRFVVEGPHPSGHYPR